MVLRILQIRTNFNLSVFGQSGAHLYRILALGEGGWKGKEFSPHPNCMDVSVGNSSFAFYFREKRLGCHSQIVVVILKIQRDSYDGTIKHIALVNFHSGKNLIHTCVLIEVPGPSGPAMTQLLTCSVGLFERSIAVYLWKLMNVSCDATPFSSCGDKIYKCFSGLT